MGLICNKCHYERQENDHASGYECPNCGAAYAKVGASLNVAEDKRQKEQPELLKKNEQEALLRKKKQEELLQKYVAINPCLNEAEEKEKKLGEEPSKKEQREELIPKNAQEEHLRIQREEDRQQQRVKEQLQSTQKYNICEVCHYEWQETGKNSSVGGRITPKMKITALTCPLCGHINDQPYNLPIFIFIQLFIGILIINIFTDSTNTVTYIIAYTIFVAAIDLIGYFVIKKDNEKIAALTPDEREKYLFERQLKKERDKEERELRKEETELSKDKAAAKILLYNSMKECKDDTHKVLIEEWVKIHFKSRKNHREWERAQEVYLNAEQASQNDIKKYQEDLQQARLDREHVYLNSNKMMDEYNKAHKKMREYGQSDQEKQEHKQTLERLASINLQIRTSRIVKQSSLCLLEGGHPGGPGTLTLYDTFLGFQSNYTLSPEVVQLDQISSANATTEHGLNGFLEVIYRENTITNRFKFTKGLGGINFFGPLASHIDPIFTEWAQAISNAVIENSKKSEPSNSQKYESAQSNFSVADEILKLADMKEKGIVSDEEFQAAKSRLLR